MFTSEKWKKIQATYRQTVGTQPGLERQGAAEAGSVSLVMSHMAETTRLSEQESVSALLEKEKKRLSVEKVKPRKPVA